MAVLLLERQLLDEEHSVEIDATEGGHSRIAADLGRGFLLRLPFSCDTRRPDAA
jgi:hypothetical protein